MVAGGGLALFVRALSVQACAPAALEQVHIHYPPALSPGDCLLRLVVGDEGKVFPRPPRSSRYVFLNPRP